MKSSEFEPEQPGGELPSWRTLVARALAGDRDGFERLFEAARPWVANLANRYMSSRLRTVLEIDDVVNIGMGKVYLGLPRMSFRSDQEFKNWLHEIVKNTAFEEDRDHFRTLKRGHGAQSLDKGGNCDSTSDNGSLKDHLAASSTGPSKLAYRREAKGILQKALDAMDVDDRRLIVARFLEGKTADVIALELHCTPRSVNRDLRVALERLRRVLKDRGLGESGFFALL